MALVAYESFQVATYGALGPAAQAEAAAHLGVNWPWWAWALVIWAVVTILGLARVEVAGRILAVLTAAEIAIVLAETISGLASPAGGHLDLGTLSPSTLTASGAGTLGVLAVIAGWRSWGSSSPPCWAKRPATQDGRFPPPPTPRWPPSGRCTPPRPRRCRLTPGRRM
jgi:amino acid transporter